MSLVKCKCKSGDRKTFGLKESKLGIASIKLLGSHKNLSVNHVRTVIIISLFPPASRLCSFTTTSALLLQIKCEGIPLPFRTLLGALVKAGPLLSLYGTRTYVSSAVAARAAFNSSRGHVHPESQLSHPVFT